MQCGLFGFVKQNYLTRTAPLFYNALMNSNDNDLLKRRIYFNLLYDYYAPLLTERQRKVYETLCFSDLTPTEAAHILGMSRQAVYVLARHVMDKLEGIERELSFAMNTRQLEARIKELEQENEDLRRKLHEKEGENESCLTH